MYRNIKYNGLIFLLVCLAGLPCPDYLHADLIFKRKVIDKCDEAKAEISTFDKEKQIESIEDLKLVLKLDIINFDSANPEMNVQLKIPAMNEPMEAVRGQGYWQSSNSDREIHAKFCALEILKSLSPYSIRALPEIIELTQNHTLPRNFQNLLFELIQSVILDAKNDADFTVSNETLTELINMLDKPYAYYAQNALIELHSISLEKLLKKMEDPDVKIRDSVTNTLLRLDNSGEIIGMGILKLLNSPDDGLRKRAINILSDLENFYPFSVPQLIERLFDISPDIQETALNALQKVFERIKNVPKIVLSDDNIKTLFKKLILNHGKGRQVLAAGLNKLMPVTDTNEKNIIAAFKTDDTELKAELLRILKGNNKISPQIKTLLFDALKDRSSQVQLHALEIINQAKLHNKISNDKLLKLLDDPGQEIKKAAETEIIKLDKTISSDLLKFFKSKKADDKPRLLRVMLQVTPNDKEVVALFESNIKKQRCENKAKLTILAPQLTKKLRPQLISDLNSCFIENDSDYTLIGDALLALSPLSKEEKSGLLSIAGSKEASDKVLTFLMLNGGKLGMTLNEQTGQIKSLLLSNDKAVKFRVINHLNSIPLAELSAASADLKAELIKFYNENSDDDLLVNETVITLSRIDPNAVNIEEFYIRQIDSSKYQWTEKYIDKLSSETALGIIRKSLDILPVSKKYIAINLAAKFSSQASEFIPLISGYIESPDNNLSYAATVAMAKIDPLNPVTQENFRKLLHRETAEQLLKENFSPGIKPMLESIRSTSVSLVEKKILTTLLEQI